MIIGICGYKGAGKSTVCETAINLARPVRPFIRIGFADPLYSMLYAMGIPEAIMTNKSRWDEPLDMLCGKTTRYACRTLGTEWGRAYIGQGVWTLAAMRRAEELEIAGYTVILDNVRMLDEVHAIMARGGRIIAFDREEGQEPVDLSHESEQAIDQIKTYWCSHRFTNTGNNLEANAREFRKILDAVAEL